MHISVSSTAMARTCWKKYYFRHELHLRPIATSSNLEQGRIVHEAFDMYYKGRPQDEITKYIIDTYNFSLSKAEYVDQEAIEISKYTALGMWLGYPHATRTDYSVVGSEREFEVPLCRGVILRGKIDRTLQKQNCIWVGETKLTGESEPAFRQRIENSYQATAYVYAMQKEGYSASGVIYDCIKKPQLRKGRTETCSQFCRRIAYDYKQRPEHYYYTYPTYRSPDQVRWFLEDMKSLSRDIALKKKSGLWYRNPDACYSYGTECEYKNICYADVPDPLIVGLYYKKGGEDGKGSGQEGGSCRFGSEQGSDGGEV